MRAQDALMSYPNTALSVTGAGFIAGQSDGLSPMRLLAKGKNHKVEAAGWPWAVLLGRGGIVERALSCPGRVTPGSEGVGGGWSQKVYQVPWL